MTLACTDAEIVTISKEKINVTTLKRLELKKYCKA
ncbi:hypothetical protein CW304_06495 [Bacillus sp. UFRGS-B20]|nr:hypothetical protein CW304_06495 [Bacillus sp. UFRGS-B20]